MARCIFVREKECPIEGDEIPLEVCRLCIEAAKTFRVVKRGGGPSLLSPEAFKRKKSA